MVDMIETDVLIVGGGGAACRAAIEAHDQGADVLMIVKGRLGHSGCTLNVGTIAGVGAWAVEKDSHLSSMRDLLAHGGYLGNQELVKILAEETPDRIKELEEWGIDFERNDDGSIAVHHAAKHTYPRNIIFKPRSPGKHDYGYPPGIAMMEVLVGEMRKRDIRVMDDVMLVDLLKGDGRVVGATALDCQDIRLVVIKAKATVVATGSYSQIFSFTTVSQQETGDGHAAAFRVGAELIDMENTQFVAASTGYLPNSIFLNAKGERFLERYGITTLKGVDKEALCYAIWKEIREGRGTDHQTVLIDMTGAWREGSAASGDLSGVEERLRQTGSLYSAYEGGDGFDPRAEAVESAPLAHTATGGIRINARCESSVPGLYAAGAVAGGVYGHARPEGYTSMITVVFGRRAGLFAGLYAGLAGEPIVDSGAIQASLDRASELVEKTGGVKPGDSKAQVQATMKKYAWVIKDDEGLRQGLKEIREIGEIQRVAARRSTSKARPKDGYQWAIAIEVPNMLLCSELMLMGSTERKESRGAFFRDDYPETDNIKWLKNIIFKTVDGETVLETAPVELTYCGPEPEAAAAGSETAMGESPNVTGSEPYGRV